MSKINNKEMKNKRVNQNLIIGISLLALIPDTMEENIM